MKGVILAGGSGTRLAPMTKVTNKHLLPVYDRPMIYYPIETLVSAGIEEILIVTGNESAGDFINLLGDGSDFGANFTYRVQKGSRGIADALRLAKHFAGESPITVILGDNIFDDVSRQLLWQEFTGGSRVFLKTVSDPCRFGVAVIDDCGKINAIVEKPKEFISDKAVVGLYQYDQAVWDIIDSLKPSARGEYEITDVNNAYIALGLMSYCLVEGFWSDAGTHESLFKASAYIRQQSQSGS